jgi:hypothetical protein
MTPTINRAATPVNAPALAPVDRGADIHSARGSDYIAAAAPARPAHIDRDADGAEATGASQARSGVASLRNPFDGAGDTIGTLWDAARKTFSRVVHDKLPPQDPKVRDHQPDVAPARESRPTAQQLRNAPLAGKQGTADLAAAQRYADEAFARLDLSDPNKDVVLWVPGTGSHEMPANVRDPLQHEFGDRATSTYVDYPADVNFGPSSATGMEAVRLLLAKIADTGGNHRVLLAGHSQGAWVIGDAMQDPTIHAAVDRAILYGNPGAANSDYTDRRDGKLIELDDPNDPVTWPVDQKEAFLRGMDMWQRGDKTAAVAELAKTLTPTNLGVGMYYLARAADSKPWGESDPHHYEDQFGAGFQWLDAGTVS